MCNKRTLYAWFFVGHVYFRMMSKPAKISMSDFNKHVEKLQALSWFLRAYSDPRRKCWNGICISFWSSDLGFISSLPCHEGISTFIFVKQGF